jgi:hypothetical protein
MGICATNGHFDWSHSAKRDQTVSASSSLSGTGGKSLSAEQAHARSRANLASATGSTTWGFLDGGARSTTESDVSPAAGAARTFVFAFIFDFLEDRPLPVAWAGARALDEDARAAEFGEDEPVWVGSMKETGQLEQRGWVSIATHNWTLTWAEGRTRSTRGVRERCIGRAGILRRGTRSTNWGVARAEPR